jgi:hypothetical protein
VPTQDLEVVVVQLLVDGAEERRHAVSAELARVLVGETPQPPERVDQDVELADCFLRTPAPCRSRAFEACLRVCCA